MSEAFRDISPEAPELQPIISGLFAEYAARYGDYFSRDAEVELSEWYVPPQGLFIVLEREGEIIATGAYKPKDRHTAEIKRIWTHRRLRQQGLAAKVVQELERRAVLAGYRCFPRELTDEQKTALAADITEVLIRHLNSKEGAVSVALTQVEPDAWQAVWDSEIAPQMAQLIKQPGYSM